MGAPHPDTEAYLEFVRKIAGKVKRQFNPPMDIDELADCGFLGLRQALDRYAPSAGVKFETFAYYRIKGAMLDEIARQCPLSRHMIRKLRLARKANDYMEGACADAGGMEGATPGAGAALIAGIVMDLSAVHAMVSVTVRHTEDGGHAVEFVDEAAAGRHQEAVVSSELRSLLGRLPGDQAELLRLYYYEDMTLEEAGRTMGFSKGWACKLHNAAIRRLRALMTKRGDTEEHSP
jgi:RNA polymerase sigma factor for flagellar operon FliA